MEKVIAVITTIHKPTLSVEKLLNSLAPHKVQLIVAGDRKGPDDYKGENVCFLSIDQQVKSGYRLATLLPENHYVRKNLGYLKAFSQGATCIYETDDDNAPDENWHLRCLSVKARKVIQEGWVNVYRNFTDKKIWPRGFPLDEIRSSCLSASALALDESDVIAPIQQGLANNSPDVDAVWRLVMDKPFDFDHGPSVVLSKGSWCPFNSQSTWWWPEAYPLMYLPSYCSFRMTDIWRSFIAQRCLWELGKGVVFHAPEVVQDRNEHDLMLDFNDEVPGYQRNREMVEVLEELSLDPGPDAVGDNLRNCYENLIEKEFFPAKELALVNTWLEDLYRLD